MLKNLFTALHVEVLNYPDWHLSSPESYQTLTQTMKTTVHPIKARIIRLLEYLLFNCLPQGYYDSR